MKKYMKLKPLVFSNDIKTFSCQDEDIGSKEVQINEDYRILRDKSEIMDLMAKRQITTHFN